MGTINCAFFDHKKEMLALNLRENSEEVLFVLADDLFVNSKVV